MSTSILKFGSIFACWHHKKRQLVKGQIISKTNFLVLIWTKNPTFFLLISALASKKRSDQKIKATYLYYKVFWFDLFLEARPEILKKVLVQTLTSKYTFEIKWPLPEIAKLIKISKIRRLYLLILISIQFRNSTTQLKVLYIKTWISKEWMQKNIS